MKRSNSMLSCSLLAAGVLLISGCESKPAEQEKAAEGEKLAEESAEQAAAKKAEEEKTAQLAAAKKAAEEPKKETRPATIDMELTSERRTAVETAYPDAKGFLVASELEEGLKQNKTIKAKEGALATFDKQAEGKWVLLAGPMVNLTEDGFDLAVTYTPQAENDPMGMSRQFFTVTLSEVEGYEQSKFKAGSQVVVLAKYDGDGKVSQGYELVEAGHWK